MDFTNDPFSIPTSDPFEAGPSQPPPQPSPQPSTTATASTGPSRPKKKKNSHKQPYQKSKAQLRSQPQVKRDKFREIRGLFSPPMFGRTHLSLLTEDTSPGRARSSIRDKLSQSLATFYISHQRKCVEL
ncbi:hypothetical protein PM082_018169 [Marasmius tenuissimus]|nr:hypothetical protein PM082_018169 [Marasmius tenuissimus]